MYYIASEFKDCALPAPILERYRTADGPALKVALYLLSGGGGEPEKIAGTLSLPQGSVDRALGFWHAAGLLTEKQPGQAAASPAESPRPAPAAQGTRPRALPGLSAERAAALTLRDPNVSVLLQEAQRFLGRPLDTAESRTLLELYEAGDFSVEVILMLIAYCLPRVRNRRSLCTMVRRIAEDWYEQGISTSGEAENQIRLLELREAREERVAAALDLKDPSFSKSQKAAIAKWFEVYGYDELFVREAYLAKGNPSIAYIGKILQGWYNDGVSGLRQVRNGGASPNAPASPSKKRGGSLLKKAVLAGSKEE